MMVSTSWRQKLMAGSSCHGTHGNPGWFNWNLIQKSIWLWYVMLGWFMGGVDLTGIYRRCSFNSLNNIVSQCPLPGRAGGLCTPSNPLSHLAIIELHWKRPLVTKATAVARSSGPVCLCLVCSAGLGLSRKENVVTGSQPSNSGRFRYIHRQYRSTTLRLLSPRSGTEGCPHLLPTQPIKRLSYYNSYITADN